MTVFIDLSKFSVQTLYLQIRSCCKVFAPVTGELSLNMFITLFSINVDLSFKKKKLAYKVEETCLEPIKHFFFFFCFGFYGPIKITFCPF